MQQQWPLTSVAASADPAISPNSAGGPHLCPRLIVHPQPYCKHNTIMQMGWQGSKQADKHAAQCSRGLDARKTLAYNESIL